MNASKPASIPKPLVTANQWFIFLSVVLSLAADVYPLLFLPLAAGLGGLLFGFNPVIYTARKLLKKPAASYIQEDYSQLQFNQTIAVCCLALSLIGFYSGLTIAGYVFSIMVALASGIALLGFCIGCFLRFQWQQYRHRRASK